MGKIRSEERFALWLGLLLELHLELLMLLLQQVEPTDAHHVSGHHIRQHIRETERGHFVMMATSGSAELLKTLQLSLGLGKVSRNAIVDLNGSCASVDPPAAISSRSVPGMTACTLRRSETILKAICTRKATEELLRGLGAVRRLDVFVKDINTVSSTVATGYARLVQT